MKIKCRGGTFTPKKGSCLFYRLDKGILSEKIDWGFFSQVLYFRKSGKSVDFTGIVKHPRGKRGFLLKFELATNSVVSRGQVNTGEKITVDILGKQSIGLDRLSLERSISHNESEAVSLKAKSC